MVLGESCCVELLWITLTQALFAGRAHIGLVGYNFVLTEGVLILPLILLFCVSYFIEQELKRQRIREGLNIGAPTLQLEEKTNRPRKKKHEMANAKLPKM